MKVVKKIIIAGMTICLLFLFTGCAKCVSTETKKVSVIVTDATYKAAYTSVLPVGKSVIIQAHPAEWHTWVKYKEKKYLITGRDTYDKYSDRKNQTAYAILEIKTYNNGKITQDIISLE